MINMYWSGVAVFGIFCFIFSIFLLAEIFTYWGIWFVEDKKYDFEKLWFFKIEKIVYLFVFGKYNYTIPEKSAYCAFFVLLCVGLVISSFLYPFMILFGILYCIRFIRRIQKKVDILTKKSE